MERPKPLLFLDVDGVLNACPPIEGEPVIEKLGFPICLPTGTKERIAALLEVFEPVWATTWRDKAHEHFWQELGLDEEPWPHIDFHTFKFLAIIDYANEIHMSGHVCHRWAWVDDDARWEMETLGLHHDGVHSLIVAPDTAQGLTDAHVEKLLAFAAKEPGGVTQADLDRGEELAAEHGWD